VVTGPPDKMPKTIRGAPLRRHGSGRLLAPGGLAEALYTADRGLATSAATAGHRQHRWRETAMRWTPGGRGRNLEDRRGSGGLAPRRIAVGGGGMIVPLNLNAVFGVDLTRLGGDGAVATAPGQTAGPVEETAEERERVAFVSAVL